MGLYLKTDVDQCLKMEAKKKRRKTQLHHLWNVISFVWSQRHLLTRLDLINGLIWQYQKQEDFLCMRICCLVCPNIWQGIFNLWISLTGTPEIYLEYFEVFLWNSDLHSFCQRQSVWRLNYHLWRLKKLRMNTAWYDPWLVLSTKFFS